MRLITTSAALLAHIRSYGHAWAGKYAPFIGTEKAPPLYETDDHRLLVYKAMEYPSPSIFLRQEEILEICGWDAGDDCVPDIIATQDVDRYTDITIIAGVGWDKYTGVVSDTHDYRTVRNILAHCVALKKFTNPKTNVAYLAGLTCYPKENDDDVRTYNLAKRGFIPGTSIGMFVRKHHNETDEEQGQDHQIFDETEMYEYAKCLVGVNPFAAQTLSIRQDAEERVRRAFQAGEIKNGDPLLHLLNGEPSKTTHVMPSTEWRSHTVAPAKAKEPKPTPPTPKVTDTKTPALRSVSDANFLITILSYIILTIHHAHHQDYYMTREQTLSWIDGLPVSEETKQQLKGMLDPILNAGAKHSSETMAHIKSIKKSLKAHKAKRAEAYDKEEEEEDARKAAESLHAEADAHLAEAMKSCHALSRGTRADGKEPDNEDSESEAEAEAKAMREARAIIRSERAARRTGGANAELLAEIRSLRAEVTAMKQTTTTPAPAQEPYDPRRKD